MTKPHYDHHSHHTQSKKDVLLCYPDKYISQIRSKFKICFATWQDVQDCWLERKRLNLDEYILQFGQLHWLFWQIFGRILAFCICICFRFPRERSSRSPALNLGRTGRHIVGNNLFGFYIRHTTVSEISHLNIDYKIIAGMQTQTLLVFQFSFN